MHFKRIAAVLFLSALPVLSGCSGGAGGLLGGTSTSCSPSSYTLQFPSASGYSITGQLNAASGCFSSATVTTYASTSPITGLPYVPALGGVTLVYIGINFSVNEYANGLPSLTYTLPAGIATAGHQFYLAHYNGVWTSVAGPVSASGSTVSFGVSNGNTTFSANTTEEIALYRV